MPATPKPSLDDNDALLTYRVGPVYCCGPTLPIITITPAPKLTHPPGSNIAEPGIFKHDNLIVSATDLRYRFGVKQEDWKHPAQVIITENGDTGRSYFVDEIIDVIRFPETGWQQLPSHLPRGIFSRTLFLNNKIYLYAEFEKLSNLQDSDYLAEYIARLEKEIKKDDGASEHLKQKNKIPTPKNFKTNTSDASIIKSVTKKISTDKTSTSNTKSADISDTPYKTKNTPIQKAKKDKSNSRTEKLSVENKKLSSYKNTPLKSPINIRQDKKDAVLSEKTTTNGINTSHIKARNIQSKSIQPKTVTSRNITTNPNSTSLNTTIKTSLQINKKERPVENINAKRKEKEQEKKYGTVLFFIILLIILPISYFYIYKSDNDINIVTKHPIKPKYSNTDTLTTSEPTTLVLEKKTHRNTSHQEDNIQVITTANPIETNITKEKNTTENNNSEYHAKIHQQTETITIELNGPQPPTIVSPHIIEAVTQSNHNDKILSTDQTDQKDEAIKEQTVVITEKFANKIEDSSFEIVHVIAKGDTLWAIAKHYLKNPFLYPELAKLSKIKNPDLIYPGNQVRIIYKKNSRKNK